MLAIGEPAFSLRRKSATDAKASPLPSAMMFPHQPETVRRSMKKSAIPISAHRDDQPVDPRSAFAQIPASDQRDVNRRGVLQKDRVRSGRHARRKNKEHDRERVADGAADLCQ